MNRTDTSSELPMSGGTGGWRGWRTLRPPVDRPAGSRGPRAWVAYLSVLAAIVVAGVSGFRADPSWTNPAMKAAAAALLLAAGLLWLARPPLLVLLSAALVPAAIAVCVLSFAARHDAGREEVKWGGSVVSFDGHGRTRPLTAAEAASVPRGASRAEVQRILGAPVGHGVQHVFDGPDLRCVAYPNDRFDPTRGGHVHAFCFSHGHLTVERDW